jgi:hypothetical protein
MKKLNVVSFLLLISILAGCSQAALPATSTIAPKTPTIVPTSTIVPPTATLTPTETNTPVPSSTPTITASPTPSIPTSCSDKVKMDEVVSAFLATTKFTTYEEYLASLEPVKPNDQGVKGVTYSSLAFNDISIPVYLLGSFEISMQNFPPAKENDKGVCLLYANPDFSRPISVLGAAEFNGRFVISSSNLKIGRIHYQAGYISKPKFFEFINSQIGKISKIALILNFYDASYFQEHKKESLEKSLSILPGNFANVVRQGYPFSEKRAHENFKDNYKHGQGVILNILSKYGTLFIFDLDFSNLKNTDFKSSNIAQVSIDETSRRVIYDDKFIDDVDLYIAKKNEKDICKKSSAYKGDCGISLTPNRDFLHFAVDFTDNFINSSDYDYVEFYLKTSGQDYSFAVFGRDEYKGWEENNGYFIVHAEKDYISYNEWLGILNSVDDSKKKDWILVRIPISKLRRDADGYIHGLSFAFFMNMGEVSIDEISLVKELKP